jgi:hypothetical protein
LKICPLKLTDDEIHGLIDYARDKFAAEQYPFALAAADPGSARQARPKAEARAKIYLLENKLMDISRVRPASAG